MYHEELLFYVCDTNQNPHLTFPTVFQERDCQLESDSRQRTVFTETHATANLGLYAYFFFFRINTFVERTSKGIYSERKFTI